MNPARLSIRCLATLLLAASAPAQDTPAPIRKPRAPHLEPPPYNVNSIFLDPAHGGDDPGARLGPGSLEKDATLALAERLRTLLGKDAFTLVTTRSATSDQPSPDATPSAPTPAPTLDQRVEVANRSRSVACLILHATSAGHGIHLFTSGLPAPTPSAGEINGAHAIVPWNTAQAASLQGSQQLASDLATAIESTHIPLVSGHVSVKPIDSMTCPAVLVELAPLTSGASQTSPSDPAYQQRVAQAIASGLHTWRAHAQAQIDTQAQIQAQAQSQSQPQAQTTQAKAATPAAKPKPTPKPTSIPEEFPEVRPPAPVLPPRPPAPIIRLPPPTIPPPVPPPTGAAQ